ncbi:alpha/beta fold hydrolase [Streptomyces sp. NPDC001852]|uniref:alpha/beta fold hydrolase n=1 Tax=Streptomyces sp. NPDC001852 TaxID=3364619 RepID=UPI0036BA76DE
MRVRPELLLTSPDASGSTWHRALLGVLSRPRGRAQTSTNANPDQGVTPDAPALQIRTRGFGDRRTRPAEPPPRRDDPHGLPRQAGCARILRPAPPRHDTRHGGWTESGEPILFLHGATLSLWIWDGLFERLARAGYRTIRFDRYGIGFSDHPDIDHNQALFEEQIIDLLEALGVDRPVTLVALAFGGPIAAEFAVYHPERVAGVCLASPDGFATPLNLGLLLSMVPGIGSLFFRLTGNRALKSRLPSYSQDPRVLARVEAGLLPELRYRGFKRSLLSALRSVPIEYLYRFLDTQDIPVQVVWGRQDPITPMPPDEVLRTVIRPAPARRRGTPAAPRAPRRDRRVHPGLPARCDPAPPCRPVNRGTANHGMPQCPPPVCQHDERRCHEDLHCQRNRRHRQPTCDPTHRARP